MEKQPLDNLWKEAMDRFQVLTQKSIKMSPPKTLDDIRKQIESDQVESSDNRQQSDGKKRAKEISLNALTCIKLLGGVAAQGASMVC